MKTVQEIETYRQQLLARMAITGFSNVPSTVLTIAALTTLDWVLDTNSMKDYILQSDGKTK